MRANGRGRLAFQIMHLQPSLRHLVNAALERSHPCAKTRVRPLSRIGRTSLGRGARVSLRLFRPFASAHAAHLRRRRHKTTLARLGRESHHCLASPGRARGRTTVQCRAAASCFGAGLRGEVLAVNRMPTKPGRLGAKAREQQSPIRS